MKKLMATCAAIALAATSTIPMTAFAAEGVKFSVKVEDAQESYKVGDTVKLSLNIDENSGCNSWSVLVHYDTGFKIDYMEGVQPKELETDSNSRKKSLAEPTLGNETDNPITFLWTDGSVTYSQIFKTVPDGHTGDEAYNYTATGTVVNMEFTVTKDVANGSHNFWVEVGPDGAAKTQGTKTAPLDPVSVPTSVANPVSVTVTNDAPPADEVTLSLDKTTLNLEEGQSEQLTATVTPAGTKVTFESDNPSAATVDETGKVTAVNAGNATITAKAGDKTATCSVIVSKKIIKDPVAVTGVAFKEEKVETTIGQTFAAEYTINPVNADNKNVTFESSNPSTATVDAAGNVTTYFPGTATITVKTEDGGFTDTLNVVVNPVSTTLNLAKGNNKTYDLADFGVPASIIPSLIYSTSDNTIATVEPDGSKITLNGLGLGTANIDVTYEGVVLATIKVTVTNEFTVNFVKNPVTIKVGDSETLALEILPADYEFAGDYNDISNWTLTCSDTSILKIVEKADDSGNVHPTGKVTGLKSGTVTVTATNPDYCDDLGNMIPVECTVNVKSVLPVSTPSNNPGETPTPKVSTDPVDRSKISPYVAALPATTSTSSAASGPIAATGGEMMVTDTEETGNAPAIAAAALGVIALGFVVVARKKRHN